MERKWPALAESVSHSRKIQQLVSICSALVLTVGDDWRAGSNGLKHFRGLVEIAVSNTTYCEQKVGTGRNEKRPTTEH